MVIFLCSLNFSFPFSLNYIRDVKIIICTATIYGKDLPRGLRIEKRLISNEKLSEG